MKSKSRKTAVLSVIILLLIMQLAFLNERKHEDNKTSIQLADYIINVKFTAEYAFVSLLHTG